MLTTPESAIAAALARTAAYWDRRCATATDDVTRVEWSVRTQRLRFEVFLRSHDVRGKRVLDLGCGTGGFLEHLERRGLDCDYTGFDLSQQMIRRCCEKFPGRRFVHGDFLTWQPDQVFDYTVAFGIHNVEFHGVKELLEQTTVRQFALARIAAHVNLLTDRYPGIAAHCRAWRAEEILALGLTVSPYVVLRHDCLPNDLCLTIYREPLIDRERQTLCI